MWDALSETYWNTWLFYFFSLERAFANVVFPVFPPACSKTTWGRSSATWAWRGSRRRRARSRARRCSSPAWCCSPRSRRASSSPQRPQRRPQRPPRPTRAPRTPWASPCSRSRDTCSSPCHRYRGPERWGTDPALLLGTGSYCGGSLGNCSSAAVRGSGSFLGMCFVMNDFSLLEESKLSTRKVENLAVKEGIHVV